MHSVLGHMHSWKIQSNLFIEAAGFSETPADICRSHRNTTYPHSHHAPQLYPCFPITTLPSQSLLQLQEPGTSQVHIYQLQLPASSGAEGQKKHQTMACPLPCTQLGHHTSCHVMGSHPFHRAWCLSFHVRVLLASDSHGLDPLPAQTHIDNSIGLWW